MSTLTPTGTGRRGPLPVVVAVIVALALGIGGGWWFAGRDKSSATPTPSSSASCSAHASTSKSGSVKPVALPDPRTIKVNVYNATKHRGLAKATSVELAARGFGIGSVANDPLNKLIVGTAEVRYGTKGAAAAKVVAAQVPTPIMVADRRKDATVDFVIGEQYSSLNTPAQAQTQLKATPTPSPSPC